MSRRKMHFGAPFGWLICGTQPVRSAIVPKILSRHTVPCACRSVRSGSGWNRTMHTSAPPSPRTRRPDQTIPDPQRRRRPAPGWQPRRRARSKVAYIDDAGSYTCDRLAARASRCGNALLGTLGLARRPRPDVRARLHRFLRCSSARSRQGSCRSRSQCAAHRTRLRGSRRRRCACGGVSQALIANFARAAGACRHSSAWSSPVVTTTTVSRACSPRGPAARCRADACDRPLFLAPTPPVPPVRRRARCPDHPCRRALRTEVLGIRRTGRGVLGRRSSSSPTASAAASTLSVGATAILMADGPRRMRCSEKRLLNTKPTSSTACPRSTPACSRTPFAPDRRRMGNARLPLRARRRRGVGRLEETHRVDIPSTTSAPPDAASSCQPRRRRAIRHRRHASAGAAPDRRGAATGSPRLRSRADCDLRAELGGAVLEPAGEEPCHLLEAGRASGDRYYRNRDGATASPGAATACSRWAASTCRRSRSSRR